MRAELDKQANQVSAMFDEVAEGYDRTRSVLWLGQMGRWGRAVSQALELRPGQRVLDVAAGTGTSSRALAAPGVSVVGCDFSPGMLQVARRRVPELEFVPGDAMDLPFEDDSFDAATISFGLRNVADHVLALAEMRRVVRPGGRVVVAEYSHPTSRLTQTAFQTYLRKAAPRIARALSTNVPAYDYLADSILAWPTQPALAADLQRAGWTRVAWRDLTGGVVALHRGFKA
ncbi:ubiquinone/menaquinone biosynthesis methyltransferase [Amycolatopsis saalfeldensis]|uniref:Demethylmenaquinone methyltransferase n=1 Tax=Amycolatopsis saalfeldensis TaxID=394193 RepID=A0A1H8Q7P7_9PSEU|nr:ubiquinone/menaquinone biosynthesis methyltransferase [Amycolatopsis saalfeldensis]SEO49927.1 2-octaprenyl-6-methoxy-1,4-benzoquinone methylase /demethylmenaquinone methyltransferase [Amycolatopsis saalfeldensis]